MKLKLRINHYLKKWGKLYISQLEQMLALRDKSELFTSVVDEMEREGLLTKEAGAKGGIILAHKVITEPQVCQKS